MDQKALVSSETVTAGDYLLTKLRENQIDVEAAGWVQADGDGKPYLYISSEFVEKNGPLAGYRKLVEVYRSLVAPRLSSALQPDDVKMVGTTNRLAKGMMDIQRTRQPGVSSSTFHVASIGGIPLEGPAYVYPYSRIAAVTNTAAH
jgi:hypothetical protein